MINVLEKFRESQIKMKLRSIYTIWKENAEHASAASIDEMMDSFESYKIIGESNKLEGAPYSDSAYQEDLLSIRDAVIGKIDLAEKAVEENHRTIERMWKHADIDYEYHKEMDLAYQTVKEAILMARINVEMNFAKFSGKTRVDLSIDMEGPKVTISNLKEA